MSSTQSDDHMIALRLSSIITHRTNLLDSLMRRCDSHNTGRDILCPRNSSFRRATMEAACASEAPPAFGWPVEPRRNKRICQNDRGDVWSVGERCRGVSSSSLDGQASAGSMGEGGRDGAGMAPRRGNFVWTLLIFLRTASLPLCLINTTSLVYESSMIRA